MEAEEIKAPEMLGFLVVAWQLQCHYRFLLGYFSKSFLNFKTFNFLTVSPVEL